MNKEEIDDWLRLFSNNNQSFMSKDGKKITLFKVFQELKELQQENQSLEKENKILRENAEHNDKVVDKFNWENQKLKKQLEEYKRLGFEHLNNKCNKLENQQKEFIEFLEKEKDRLARECSPTYEGSLGKKRFVNEDIFNEVDKILSKYYEIIDK